jgi:aminobenzoyl-glutamate transport protein
VRLRHDITVRANVFNRSGVAMNHSDQQDSNTLPKPAAKGVVTFALDLLERLGNKLPDPAVLFLLGMLITWVLSSWLSGFQFQELDPRNNQPIEIVDLLSSKQLALFLSGMVGEFARFPPLGVVLVALLGVGVAEHSGFINACLRNLLAIAPQRLLTPMLLLVAVLSHTAVDAGYVLVIPIGGIMFYVAGRHPLAGVAAAFAGVSGGFSANFVPSALDPMLAKITQSGVELVAAERTVNPLCNIFFTASSTLLIVLLGWFLTDVVVEPRLRRTPLDGDPQDMPQLEAASRRDQIAMFCGLGVMLLGLLGLVAWVWPSDSALRAPDGSLTSADPPVPLMQSIVPLIFLAFLLPGVVHGYVSGKFRSHRDVVKGMTRSMEAMGYYLVLVFFAALFIASFRDSNLGVLLAVKGAGYLKQIGASPAITIVGIILLTAVVNLVIGSASAKWAMLAPIFVPMLMLVGLSPELTQAAYRVGDSSTNIITPMMPYFPLVVVFCQRYVKSTGIGTLAAMMMPYSVAFLIGWTLFLLGYWALELPLGLQAPYTYQVPMIPPG